MVVAVKRGQFGLPVTEVLALVQDPCTLPRISKLECAMRRMIKKPWYHQLAWECSTLIRWHHVRTRTKTGMWQLLLLQRCGWGSGEKCGHGEAQVGCSQDSSWAQEKSLQTLYCFSQEGSDTLNVHQNQWQQSPTHSMLRQELNGIITIPSISIFGEDIYAYVLFS